MFIDGHIRAHGYSPIWREICAHLGARSTNSCHDHIVALERKGMITRQKRQSRTITLTAAGRAEVARVRTEAAGART